MRAKLESLAQNRIARFVLSSGLNTIATYLLFLALLRVMHYQAAYLISYAAGIALAYVLNTMFVFDARHSIRKMLSYPFIYIIQYGAGAGLLYVFVDILHVPTVLAPALVILCVMPLSYVMNKFVLANGNRE